MEDESLTNKLKAWLDKQGFPLELRVAKTLQMKGFSVVQSSYYNDFEENKPRETDVVGRLYGHFESHDDTYLNELETYAVFECKSSAKPWVCFRGAPISHWDADLFLTNRSGKKLISSLKTKLGSTDLFLTTKYCYSAALAFIDEGRAFSAMMSVMKASESLYQERLKLDKPLDSYEASAYIPVVHAAVVTTAPVYECSVDDTYEVALKEVPQSVVALQYPRQRQESADAFVIHVVNISALSGFVEKVKSSHLAAVEQLKSFDPRIQ